MVREGGGAIMPRIIEMHARLLRKSRANRGRRASRQAIPLFRAGDKDKA